MIPSLLLEPRLFKAEDHFRRSQLLGAITIVNNARSTTSFDLAEAALPNSSARASQSHVAQQEYNASHAALSYDNAADITHKGLAKGHTPSHVTKHKYNELIKQKLK